MNHEQNEFDSASDLKISAIEKFGYWATGLCSGGQKKVNMVSSLGLKASITAKLGYCLAAIGYLSAIVIASMRISSLSHGKQPLIIGDVIAIFAVAVGINLLSAIVHRSDLRLQLELKKYVARLKPDKAD